MKRTAKYVGLDVHQATTVVSVREDTGRVIARTILPTDAPAILEYIRGMRGAVQVALEEGTQAQWLHDLLVPVVDATNCRACHGDFRASIYTSPAGVNWGVNLHDLHRTTMLSGDCNTCHNNCYQ